MSQLRSAARLQRLNMLVNFKQGRSDMRTISLTTGLAIMFAAAAPAMAETLRSKVAFNTAIQKPAASQPEGGHAMTWDVKLSGGELDGCTASFAESLFPRDNMSWGIFQLEASVACDRGAFQVHLHRFLGQEWLSWRRCHQRGRAQRGVRAGRGAHRHDRRNCCAGGDGGHVRCRL
jgi:hypothetical protein